MPFLIQLIGQALGWLARVLGASIFKAFSSVWAWVLFYLPQIFIYVLKALGVGFITYSLGSFGIDAIYNHVETNLSGLPTVAIQFLKVSGILDAIPVILGALSARVTYSLASGSGSGKKKQMAFLA